ncbi:MAG: glutamine--fructose-6-phosphate transaminase (isomerizing) [Desulfotomaculaceae bacterium]|nr:glutamine--fructose-6-phosphate transaminase (isomerizing) [Desulfotomaculaceae bacterium]
MYSIEKDGYVHFMLKEIHEQPQVLQDTMSARISAGGAGVVFNEVSLSLEEIKNIKKIHIAACGTAYHAGLAGKNYIERLARIPVEVEIASEFRYRRPILEPGTLVMVISQSGETADTLAALREAKNLGARVIAVTNVMDSTMSREADDVIYTVAGPEIAIASTKAYAAQLMIMVLFALYLAAGRSAIGSEEMQEILSEIKELTTKARRVLMDTGELKKLAGEFAGRGDVFFTGRCLDYAVAMEGTLKLKETTYIHAEAIATGEMRHGPMALIEKNVPIVAVATQENLLETMAGNIQELTNRGASVAIVAMEGFEELEKVAGRVFYIPKTHPFLAPLLAVIPLQFLAYYTAVAKGLDVDQPRNLTKSVSAE